jgi:hypothetical protein
LLLRSEAFAQHLFQRHRSFVLLQEVGDRLVDQILEGLAALAASACITSWVAVATWIILRMVRRAP